MLAIIFWSSTFGVASSLVDKIGAFYSSALIYFTASIFSYLFASLHQRQFATFRVSLSKQLTALTLLFALYIILIYNAISLVDSSQQLLEIGIVNYLWTVAIIVLSIPILKNKASLSLYFGVAIAMLGIIVTISQKGELSVASFSLNLKSNPLPYSLTFIAALSLGLYTNLNRLWEKQLSLDSLKYVMLFTAFIALVGGFIFPFNTKFSSETIYELLYLSFVLSLGYYLWDIATRKGNFIVVGIISYLTPLFTTIFTCWYLNITASSEIYVGCILLIIGAIISKFSINARS